MHELYELKEKLIEDLKEYGKKRDLSGPGLEIVDKLAHAAKNVCKVIESMEQGNSYDGSYDGGSYRGGMSNYSRNGSSYRGRGRYAARDSMGRYSSANEDIVERLNEMMGEAPNEKIRQSMQKLVEQIEQM